MSAPVASDTRSPLSASSEISACSAGEPSPAIDRQLPPGSVLALYTDGLIEQPGQDISAGMSRLARALAAGPARSPDDLCDSVLASLAPRPRDDVALLLARTTTTP
jgi:stage II sporulation SpoE-like protein